MKKVSLLILFYLYFLLPYNITIFGIKVIYIFPYLTYILACFYIDLKNEIYNKKVIFFMFFNFLALVLIILFSLNNDLISIIAGLNNYLLIYIWIFIGLYSTKYFPEVINNIFVLLTIINSILAFLFFFYDNLAKFLYSFYYDSYTVYKTFAMKRNIGLFVSPAALGAFSIISAFYFYYVYKGKFKKLLYFLSIFVGLTSISKTFVLSFFIFLVLILFRNIKLHNYDSIIIEVVGVFVLIFAIILFYNANDTFRSSFDYLMSFFKGNSYNNILVRRYTWLHGMINISLYHNYMIFGSGFVKSKDIGNLFIGDSGYLLQLLYGGIFSVFFFYFSYIFLINSYYSLVLYLLALSIDFGRPAFWGNRFSSLLNLLIIYLFINELTTYKNDCKNININRR